MGIRTTAKKSAKRSGLGKGLAAIIKANPTFNSDNSGFIADLPIDKLTANPNQPRVLIETEELIGLADSIRAHGIIEPLIVTAGGEGMYRLVAGERRWRAAKLAQLKTIPVIVKEISPQDILELAIIENIQRKDLNPLEEGLAISELYNSYRIKLDEIAKKIGKDVSTISNKMRLLKLPKIAQTGLLENVITESHAYSLLSLNNKDAIVAAYSIVKKQSLSVRKTDELVRKLNLATESVIKPKKRANAIVYDENTAKISDELSKKLGKGFRLIRKKTGGKMTVPFVSDNQLEQLHKLLVSKSFLDE